MTVSTYKITKNVSVKKVEVTVGDQMSLPEAERFATEFQQTAASVDANNFELHVDCAGMKVLNQEIAGALEGAMELYLQAAFKKVIFVVQNDPILKMQLSRIARRAGLTNAEVINQ